MYIWIYTFIHCPLTEFERTAAAYGWDLFVQRGSELIWGYALALYEWTELNWTLKPLFRNPKYICNVSCIFGDVSACEHHVRLQGTSPPAEDLWTRCLWTGGIFRPLSSHGVSFLKPDSDKGGEETRGGETIWISSHTETMFCPKLQIMLPPLLLKVMIMMMMMREMGLVVMVDEEEEVVMNTESRTQRGIKNITMRPNLILTMLRSWKIHTRVQICLMDVLRTGHFCMFPKLHFYQLKFFVFMGVFRL